jgi:hypothetical protein
MGNKCIRRPENLTEVSDLNGVARLHPLLMFSGNIAKIETAVATLQKIANFSDNFANSPVPRRFLKSEIES